MGSSVFEGDEDVRSCRSAGMESRPLPVLVLSSQTSHSPRILQEKATPPVTWHQYRYPGDDIVAVYCLQKGWGSHSDEVKNSQGGSDGSAGDPSAVPGAMPIGGELTVGGAGGGASHSPLLNYDPECARMEAWLDEHQDFVHDYFIRKASRHMVDAWLVSHALPQNMGGGGGALGGGAAGGGAGGAGGAFGEAPTAARSGVSRRGPALRQAPTGRWRCVAPSRAQLRAALSSWQGRPAAAAGGGSWGGTAWIGAATPVRKISAHEFEKGGLLKPIVTTIDGTPTFLSPAADAENVAILAKVRRKSRTELKGLDERQLIFRVGEDICNDLDVRSLCHKILQNVSILTSADRCSLFLVQGIRYIDT
nr:dual 3',5'-cyclic-AMP and -GMP phosphodiesterase 11-like [Penaeus vannamei]